MFVLENVVGLATYQDGATLAAMLECFQGLGYECDWRILNAAHYGIPQKRERLILIGAEKGGQVVFPKPTHACDADTIGFRDKSRMLRPADEPLLMRTKPLPRALGVMDAIGDLPPIANGESASEYDRPHSNDFQLARRRGAQTLTLHSSTRHTDRMMKIIRHSGPNISSIPKHLITSGFSSCYSRLDADEPSVTITVNFVHPASNRCIHPKLDRALTPREGARLQSFDDDFEFAGNRTQIVKQIGNAVPPLLGRAIADALAPLLS
jgi:DNA (cytosine-5)-methyltransferase 1